MPYLDYNATTPVYPDAARHMQEALAQPANPSSTHAYGREAKKRLEAARRTLAEVISAWPNEIVFTASGTEANNTALRAFPGRRIIVSAMEHSSILRHPRFMRGSKAQSKPPDIPAQGGDDTLAVLHTGITDLAALDALLATDATPALVSVMLANNETGVIQPVSEVAAICKKRGALLHCDAVQALGKIPVDFGALGCDMMTLSAHKCGGPVGAAALVARRDLAFAPLLVGGGQEMGRRAGTENVAAIAGFAAAMEKIDIGHMQKLRGWFDTMETQMLTHGASVFGKEAPRLPNTSHVAMPGVSSEVQLMDFDLKGFAVSAGSACSSGRVEPSHVLAAMGVPKELAGCAIRISGGWNTDQKEIQEFTETWKQLWTRLKGNR